MATSNHVQGVGLLNSASITERIQIGMSAADSANNSAQTAYRSIARADDKVMCKLLRKVYISSKYMGRRGEQLYRYYHKTRLDI
jgi:hypothetical protein